MTGDRGGGIRPLVTELQENSVARLRQLLGSVQNCALVGFPEHANVGDSAIWLGERAVSRQLNIDTSYACHVGSFSEQSLSLHFPTGTICCRVAAISMICGRKRSSFASALSPPSPGIASSSCPSQSVSVTRRTWTGPERCLTNIRT